MFQQLNVCNSVLLLMNIIPIQYFIIIIIIIIVIIIIIFFCNTLFEVYVLRFN